MSAVDETPELDDDLGVIEREDDAPTPVRSRDDVLDELDRDLATVVRTSVERLLTQSYDGTPLDVIVRATALRLDLLRERTPDVPPTTDTEGARP